MKTGANNNIKISNAGITPFAVAPNNANDIYVLLGKEENIEGWKYGSNKWCNFSGRVEYTMDCDVEYAAAREFVEESMAVVNLNLNSKHNYEKDIISDIHTELKSKKYTHKITMKKSGHNSEYSAVNYLKRIPWQPNLPAKFDSIRNRLLTLKAASDNYNECISKMKNFNIPIPGNKMTNPDDPEIDMGVIVNMTLTDEGKQISYSYWNMCKQELLYNTMTLTCEQNNPHIKNIIEQIADAWNVLRDIFIQLPQSIVNHPALVIHMVPETRLLTNVTVKKCHMEKQCIGWWSLPRLVEAIKQGGIYRNDIFRPSFMPYLAVIINILKTHQCDYKSDILDDNNVKTEHTNNLKTKCQVDLLPWRYTDQHKNTVLSLSHED